MALCILLTFLTGCKKNATGEEAVIESLFEPTVMITAGEYRATGVIIDVSEELISIATVAHLMEGFDQGIITFYQEKVGFADVSYINTDEDICIMTIETKNFDKRFVSKLRAATIDLEHYDALSRDDTVYVCGSQVKVAGNVCKGTFKEKDYYVPEFDQYLMYLYCDVFEGMSGSGCYDIDGVLVGLVCAGTDDGEALCIPISDIYEKWRIEINDKD